MFIYGHSWTEADPGLGLRPLKLSGLVTCIICVAAAMTPMSKPVPVNGLVVHKRGHCVSLCPGAVAQGGTNEPGKEP